MRKVWMLAAVLALLPAAPAGTAAAAEKSGTTYYVDAVAGRDTNAGTSQATAWQSLAKASQVKLGPGDRLLFKAGQRWQGQLNVTGAGAPGTPAVVGVYGTGAKPIIDGQGLVDAAVRVTNVHDFVLDGLEVTNYSSDTSTYRSGVNLFAKDAGELKNISIRNLKIHGINGMGGHSVGAAGLLISIRGNQVPTYFDNLVVERNEISDVGSYGIITWSTWSRRNGMTSLYPVETGVPDSEVVTWTPSTRVQLRANTVHDVTGGGITVMHTRDAVIEGNRVDRAVRGRTKTTGGNVGIWWQGTDDTVVQRNEVSGTGFNGPGSDGHAFDADADNNRSLIQYNYSHGNDGGFFITVSFAGAPTRDTVVRYNVSRDDGYETFGMSTATSGTDIYNNTIYATARVVVVEPPMAGAGSYPLEKIARIYNDAARITVRNNIFINLAGARFDDKNGAIYDHNLYWGTAQPPTAADYAPITADPLLVAAGSDDPADYRPLDGSPVVNAGVSQPADVDYAGTTVPDAAPDLGAFQRPVGLPQVSSTVGPKGQLQRMADRDPTTYWQSVANAHLPATIDLTHDVERVFSTVTLTAAQSATEVRVQVPAGDRWKTVADANLTWPGSGLTQKSIPLSETVTASRVRLVVDAAPASFRINEITLGVPGADGSNPPPWTGPIVTTTFPSASTEGWKNLIDGDLGSPWATQSSGVTFPGEFVVDYRTARDISTVTLHTAWAQGQGITDVSLDTWDGRQWVPQVAHHLTNWQHNNATVESSTITLPATVNTQKIRLTAHAANLSWGNIALYEIVTS